MYVTHCPLLHESGCMACSIVNGRLQEQRLQVTPSPKWCIMKLEYITLQQETRLKTELLKDLCSMFWKLKS